MITADPIKDTLIAQAGRIITLDSITIAALREQVNTLMRNETRWQQVAAEKDGQIKVYADNEKTLRKRIRRQKFGGFVAYFLAAGLGFLAVIK